MATTIVCDEKIYQANSNLRQLLTDKRFTMRIDKLETRTMKLRDEIQLDKCSFLHFHSAKPINVTLYKTDGSKIDFSASILTCDFDIKSAILSNINDTEVLTYLVYGVSGKEISYSSPVYYGALNYNSPDERDILELEKSISILNLISLQMINFHVLQFLQIGDILILSRIEMVSILQPLSLPMKLN